MDAQSIYTEWDVAEADHSLKYNWGGGHLRRLWDGE